MPENGLGSEKNNVSEIVHEHTIRTSDGKSREVWLTDAQYKMLQDGNADAVAYVMDSIRKHTGTPGHRSVAEQTNYDWLHNRE